MSGPCCSACREPIEEHTSRWYDVTADVTLDGVTPFVAGQHIALCPVCADLLARGRYGDFARRWRMPADRIGSVAAALMKLVDSGSLTAPMTFAEWVQLHPERLAQA